MWGFLMAAGNDYVYVNTTAGSQMTVNSACAAAAFRRTDLTRVCGCSAQADMRIVFKRLWENRSKR